MPNIPPKAPPIKHIPSIKAVKGEKLTSPDATEPTKKSMRKYKIPASDPFKSPLFKTWRDI